MFSCLHTLAHATPLFGMPPLPPLIYCPHLLSGRSLSFSETLLKCHLLYGAFPDRQNEWFFLSAPRKPLLTISHSALPLSISVSDPTSTGDSLHVTASGDPAWDPELAAGPGAC